MVTFQAADDPELPPPDPPVRDPLPDPPPTRTPPDEPQPQREPVEPGPDIIEPELDPLPL